MMKKTIGPLILILTIVGAAVWIYRSQTTTQKFDLNPYQALGAGVAEETAKLLGNAGQVVVIAPETSESKDPAMEGQLNSFQNTLKSRGLTVAATIRYRLTPMERMGTGGAVPRDRLFDAVQKHPNVGAVVLFAGFPSLPSQDQAALKQSSAKFVVASGNNPNYRNLLEAQVIHLAIVPQFDRSATTAKKSQTLQEWFVSEFEVLKRGS